MKKTAILLCFLVLIGSAQAKQTFTENVQVGESTDEKIFTVYGQSRLEGITRVGSASDSGSLSVYGDQTLVVANGSCKKHYFGYEAFKPMEDQLALEFCSTDSGEHGAIVALTLATTCTLDSTPWATVYSVIQQFPLIYIHPNSVAACANITTAIRYNEDANKTTVPSALQFSPVFRKDGISRICVGLAKLESHETDTWIYPAFYREISDYACETGCLFYEVISCNLSDLTLTRTSDVSMDLVGDLIEAKLLAMYPTNETRRNSVADKIVEIGTDFINLLIDLLDPTDPNGNYGEGNVATVGEAGTPAGIVIDSLVDLHSLSLSKISKALDSGKTSRQLSQMLKS